MVRVDPFAVEFSGNKSELKNAIESMYGVEEASVSLQYENEMIHHETRLTFDITYDADMTDRTRLCNQILELEGVSDVENA